MLFCCDWGVKEHFDLGFGTSFAWDVPVTAGYRHRFVPNLRRNGGPNGFLDLVNPKVAVALLHEKFDALLIYGWAFATNWIAVLSAATASVPILLRGDTSIDLQRAGLYHCCKRMILWPLFDRIAAFLAIGTNNTAFYRSFGVDERKIFLAPFSVDNITSSWPRISGYNPIAKRSGSGFQDYRPGSGFLVLREVAETQGIH